MMLRGLCALLAALAAAGCSLDYKEAEMQESFAEGIPDTVLYGVTHRIVRKSHLAVSFEADKLESYTKKKLTLLTAIHFQEFSEAGDPVTEGRAESVTYHTETEDAELDGSVKVHSFKEKATVTTGSLAWANERKVLTADPTRTVVLEKEDGSYVTGSGFQGDFRTKIMSFSGPVVGRYVSEDK
jgi:LPS export ABC transporter protein LptC